VVKAEAQRIGVEARRVGLDEPDRALAADALVRLACRPRPSEADGGQQGSDGGAPAAMVHVRVDHAALMRGHVSGGEVCELPGIGPIPVEVARTLAADSILSVLLVDGVDVMAVSRADRTIPAALRTALVERDPTCVVPGCEVRDRLEIDHIRPFADGGPTALDNLARLCHWHHYLKTFQQHRLERVDTSWRWTVPTLGALPPHPATRAG
jgi:hypothetical protein